MPPQRYKIEYLPIADRDLAEIFSYIAVDLAAPQAASDLLDKIEQAVQTLGIFPYVHSVYRSTELDTEPFEFRVLVVAPYLVFYYVAEDTVTIARVVHGRRDIQNIL
jgi:plasmid stabilization system protein ParE